MIKQYKLLLNTQEDYNEKDVYKNYISNTVLLVITIVTVLLNLVLSSGDRIMDFILKIPDISKENGKTIFAEQIKDIFFQTEDMIMRYVLICIIFGFCAVLLVIGCSSFVEKRNTKDNVLMKNYYKEILNIILE